MLFFALLIITTLFAALAGRVGSKLLSGWPDCIRLGLSVSLIFVGVDHLLTPERYLPMIEGFVPVPHFVVLATGVCEISGAIALFLPGMRRLAGLLLAVYFVCVFPANVANAINGLSTVGLPQADWYYWLRLPLQPIAVAAALLAGGFQPQTSWKPHFCGPIRSTSR